MSNWICHRICLFSVVSCCFAMLPSPAVAFAVNEERLVVDFGDQSRIAINIVGEKVVAAYRDTQHARQTISVSPDVQALILHSDDLRFLVGDPHSATGLAMILSTVPSTALGGTGYCGAGKEEYAVLLQKRERALYLVDRYLLQSCLRSIAIDADAPDTVASGLSIDRPAFSLTFKLLGDPAEQPTTLRVRDGKFWKQ